MQKKSVSTQNNSISAQLSSMIDSWVKIIILIVLLILGLIAGRATSPVARESEQNTDITYREKLPAEKDECQADGSDWICGDSARLAEGFSVKFADLPTGVKPYIIDSLPEDVENANYYGFDCKILTVGNIIFGDGTYIVNKFSEPVTLTMTYDFAQLSNSECGENLDINDIVPIVLTTPFGQTTTSSSTDKSISEQTNVWVRYPGQYTIDQEAQTMTLTFTTWGDQQTGYGTPPK
jgi:hypothetical protein